MYRIYNSKIKADTVTILPGEHYASAESEIIYTVLGSCISVALYDPKLNIGGMNHFMLAECINKDKPFFETQSGRYGINAMELLINSLLKLGASKSRLCAKVFGGSKILKVINGRKDNVADQNIKFAFEFLQTENINVVSSDTGGEKTRKVLFFTQTGKVYLQKIKNINHQEVLKNNLELLEQAAKDNLTLFQ